MHKKRKCRGQSCHMVRFFGYRSMAHTCDCAEHRSQRKQVQAEQRCLLSRPLLMYRTRPSRDQSSVNKGSRVVLQALTVC